MFNDCFNLKIGWMVSMYIPVVPLGFDMAYPAELQGLCALFVHRILNAFQKPSVLGFGQEKNRDNRDRDVTRQQQQ